MKKEVKRGDKFGKFTIIKQVEDVVQRKLRKIENNIINSQLEVFGTKMQEAITFVAFSFH
jgi:hypothetical protein